MNSELLLKSPPIDDEDKNYIVPNLDRACTVMEYLADQGVPCSLSDLARVLDMPKNSVFRILYTLQKRNFVRQVGQEYQLSSKLLTLGHSIVSGSTLLEKATPYLRELRDVTRETVGFAVMGLENRGVVMEQFPSPEAIKITITIGHLFPLHTAAPGKILVAFRPKEEQDKIVDSLAYTGYTKNTITSPEAYRKELAEVRVSGYALDREEEIEHIVCAAAPVFDLNGKIIASLWITGPLFRIPLDQITQAAATVVEYGTKISRELGFGGDISDVV